jgi:hypothetical protein
MEWIVWIWPSAMASPMTPTSRSCASIAIAGRRAGLHPSLPPRVLATNAHVIPKAIQPEDAFLAFRGLEDITEPGVRVRRVLWSSPPNELDATIVEPQQLPAGAMCRGHVRTAPGTTMPALLHARPLP